MARYTFRNGIAIRLCQGAGTVDTCDERDICHFNTYDTHKMKSDRIDHSHIFSKAMVASFRLAAVANESLTRCLCMHALEEATLNRSPSGSCGQ